MGRYKEIMMERDENPLEGVSERLVSAHLFKNKLVHEYVMSRGFDGECSYCGDLTKVLPLRSVVEKIDSIILKYYGETSNEGLGWDSGFEDDTPGFHSEEGGYIVPNNKPYYDDMHQLLFENGFMVDDDQLEQDIAEALSYHFSMIERDPYGLNEAEEHIVDWGIIKENAMKMANTGLSLEAMVRAETARLDYLKSDIYQAHYPLQVKRTLTLYRTVNYREKPNPLTFSNLTSPPAEYTCDLRMSARGDSVFYGADNAATARREALCGYGDQYSYIGKFQTKHEVRLLDLTGIPEQLSIFDQEQYFLLLFLRYFCNAVSEYVPEHDSVSYAPTQLITYYFRHHLKHYETDGSHHPIDGILYTSSKDGATNAVLFYDNEQSADHLELLEWENIYKG